MVSWIRTFTQAHSERADPLANIPDRQWTFSSARDACYRIAIGFLTIRVVSPIARAQDAISSPIARSPRQRSHVDKLIALIGPLPTIIVGSAADRNVPSPIARAIDPI